MISSVFRKTAAVAAFLLILLLSSCSSRKSSDIDWDEKVHRYLAAYQAELSLEGPIIDEENDRVLYNAVTKDGNAISFTVVCSYAKATSPLGGTRLVKEEKVTDDFYQSIMDRISEQYGEKDLTELSGEESVRYICETIARVRSMAESYGIQRVDIYSPRVRFVLKNGDRSWTAEIREVDEDRLEELLQRNLGKM